MVNTMITGWRGASGWGYRAILTDAVVLAFAAIGFAVVMLVLMGHDGTTVFEENGPVELVEAAMLLATALCGILGYANGSEKLGYLCGIAAFVSLAFLLRETPRCESIDSFICLSAGGKRPATVVAALAAAVLLTTFVRRDRAGFISSLNPRFAWPFGVVLLALAAGQLAEKWHWEAAEEMLELYAYAVLFQATAFLASAFLPRLNWVLSARRAIPIRKRDDVSKASGL